LQQFLLDKQKKDSCTYRKMARNSFLKILSLSAKIQNSLVSKITEYIIALGEPEESG
jgi:hypothetical protein